MTNLKIKIPQIIWIGLSVLVIAREIALNGQLYESHHSWFAGLIGTALQTALLYWGGFFTRENPEQPRIKPVSHFTIDD